MILNLFIENNVSNFIMDCCLLLLLFSLLCPIQYYSTFAYFLSSSALLVFGCTRQNRSLIRPPDHDVAYPIKNLHPLPGNPYFQVQFSFLPVYLSCWLAHELGSHKTINIQSYFFPQRSLSLCVQPLPTHLIFIYYFMFFFSLLLPMLISNPCSFLLKKCTAEPVSLLKKKNWFVAKPA